MSQPKLIAKFRLDDHGKPIATEAAGATHYAIELAVDGAPDDAYAVTYKLHESYRDPIRESRDFAARFRELLTSYGDYTVRAEVRGRSRIEPLASRLSEALARGIGDSPPPEIAAALARIRKL